MLRMSSTGISTLMNQQSNAFTFDCVTVLHYTSIPSGIRILCVSHHWWGRRMRVPRLRKTGVGGICLWGVCQQKQVDSWEGQQWKHAPNASVCCLILRCNVHCSILCTFMSSWTYTESRGHQHMYHDQRWYALRGVCVWVCVIMQTMKQGGGMAQECQLKSENYHPANLVDRNKPNEFNWFATRHCAPIKHPH